MSASEVAPNPFWYAKSIAALTSRDRLSICALVMFAHKSVDQLSIAEMSKPVKPLACIGGRAVGSAPATEDPGATLWFCRSPEGERPWHSSGGGIDDAENPDVERGRWQGRGPAQRAQERAGRSTRSLLLEP